MIQIAASVTRKGLRGVGAAVSCELERYVGINIGCYDIEIEVRPRERCILIFGRAVCA